MMPMQPSEEEALRKICLRTKLSRVVVLKYLHENEPTSFAPLTAIADISSASMTETAETLQKQGLVTCTPSSYDKRITLMSIAPRGIQFLKVFRDMLEHKGNCIQK